MPSTFVAERRRREVSEIESHKPNVQQHRTEITYIGLRESELRELHALTSTRVITTLTDIQSSFTHSTIVQGRRFVVRGFIDPYTLSIHTSLRAVSQAEALVKSNKEKVNKSYYVYNLALAKLILILIRISEVVYKEYKQKINFNLSHKY